MSNNTIKRWNNQDLFTKKINHLTPDEINKEFNRTNERHEQDYLQEIFSLDHDDDLDTTQN